MKGFRVAAALAVSILAAGGSAQAHHSLSAYDITKSIEVAGTIKRFEWTAPHCWLVVTAPDGKGGTTEWSFEAGTPVVNHKYGWTRNVFKPGEKVTVKAAPVRDGSPHGALMVAEFPDGRKLAGPLALYLKQ